MAAVAIASALAALAGAWAYNKATEKAGAETVEERKHEDEVAEDPSEECTICLINKRTAAFVPCGHQCVCISCAE